MTEKIRKIYKEKGLTPPDGKGIHTEKFHDVATSIKQSNPELPMKSAYAIAMSKLGKKKAVKKSHQQPTHHSAPMGSFWDKRSSL